MSLVLTYLKNKKFIGDVSLQDADVLCQYASKSKRILEFGSGGSTQLLMQSGSESVTSVETDPFWISITKKRIEQIQSQTSLTFSDYTTEFNDQKFDMIFVDGVDHLRRQFAVETWKYLEPNGVMLFHDTRRARDFENASSVAQLYHNEIYRIDVNQPASNGLSSNITVLHKKPLENYVDWTTVEGKSAWAYGNCKDECMPLWEYEP